jgi:type II secretory pathway component PulF
MKKSKLVLASVFLLITGGMAGEVIYLAFVFPKILAIWEQEARALSALQKLIANFSSFCTQYGRMILPFFLLGFLASLVWLLVTVMKKSTAYNET